MSSEAHQAGDCLQDSRNNGSQRASLGSGAQPDSRDCNINPAMKTSDLDAEPQEISKVKGTTNLECTEAVTAAEGETFCVDRSSTDKAAPMRSEVQGADRKVEEIFLLKYLKQRTAPRAPKPTMPPIEATMSIRRNDMNEAERSFVGSLLDSIRGTCKYDFVPKISKFIYRSRFKDCVNPYSNVGGLPINSNGLRKHYQTHIGRDQPHLQQDIHLRFRMRGNRVQHYTISRHAGGTIRKRYVRSGSHAEGSNLDTQPKLMSQVSDDVQVAREGAAVLVPAADTQPHCDTRNEEERKPDDQAGENVDPTPLRSAEDDPMMITPDDPPPTPDNLSLTPSFPPSAITVRPSGTEGSNETTPSTYVQSNTLQNPPNHEMQSEKPVEGRVPHGQERTAEESLMAGRLPPPPNWPAGCCAEWGGGERSKGWSTGRSISGW